MTPTRTKLTTETTSPRRTDLAPRRWPKAGLVQGAYFLATGVWPLLNMKSFEAVTGPKTDRWLVKTVGALIAAIGATLLAGSRRDPVTAETRLLGASTAAVLAAVDGVYVAKRRISAVYALDAVVELALLASWMRPWRRASAEGPR